MNRILFVFATLFILSITSAYAETLSDNYYPYNPKWADVYIGVSVGTDADQTINKPVWGALYNPMDMLQSYSFNYAVGIRPLGLIPIIRNFRVEGEGQFRYAQYNIIYDAKLATWKNKTDLPSNGKIYAKNVRMFNMYYDIRWFSDIFYPYVGFGVGAGKVAARAIDFNELPNGVGAEYSGTKDNSPMKQFMFGLQYDTKIIKTSVFVEYRFISSGSFTATPTFYGDEGGTDTAPIVTPPGYIKPVPRTFSYKAQSLTVGVKYYLY